MSFFDPTKTAAPVAAPVIQQATVGGQSLSQYLASRQAAPNPFQQVQAPVVTAAQTGPAAQSAPVQVNGQGGAAQTDALGILRGSAMGGGPAASLGQALIHQGADAGIQAAQAQAASQRGNVNAGAALHQTQQTGAGISQNAAQNAAQMGLQQQIAAQNAYAQAAQGARGQDQNAAGMDMSNNQFNAGQTNQNNQFNTSQTNTVGLANAGNNMTAQQANVESALKQEGLTDDAISRIIGSMTTANVAQGQVQSQTNNINAENARQSAGFRNSLFGQVLGAGGSLLASNLGGAGGAAGAAGAAGDTAGFDAVADPFAGGAGLGGGAALGAGGGVLAGAGAGTATAGAGAAGASVADLAPLALLASHGALVPGKAPVKGDNPRNDIVPAKLSPGEVVLPRSVVSGPDAPKKAAAFVHALLHKMNGGK